MGLKKQAILKTVGVGRVSPPKKNHQILLSSCTPCIMQLYVLNGRVERFYKDVDNKADLFET